METKTMDNESYFENYRDLIFSYLRSSLSNEDEQQLMEWVRRDPANKLYFDECHEVWLATKLSPAQKEFNSNEAFQRFKKNIAHTIVNEQHTFRKLSISFGKAAAVLILAFTVGMLVASLLHKKENAQPLTYCEITVPAGSKTKMNLPDGTQVWLNSK